MVQKSQPYLTSLQECKFTNMYNIQFHIHQWWCMNNDPREYSDYSVEGGKWVAGKCILVHSFVAYTFFKGQIHSNHD